MINGKNIFLFFVHDGLLIIHHQHYPDFPSALISVSFFHLSLYVSTLGL